MAENNNNAWHEFQRESIENELKNVLPILMGSYPIISQALYSYYSQLINAGFSSTQALQIVKFQGIMAGVQNNNENKGE